MNRLFIRFCFRVAAITLLCFSAISFAQNTADTIEGRPMFERLAPRLDNEAAPATVQLPTFYGSLTYGTQKFPYVMVGSAPAKGKSTTIPVYIIPIKLVSGSTTRDPNQKLKNGKTVVQNTVASPIFQTGIDFVQGGIDLGNTQYIDAFQRGNFWGKVQKHPGYHLLLGQPTIEPEQTLTVPAAYGGVGTVYGVSVIGADIFWFDSQITPMISQLGIEPNALPIFVTYDSYLLENGGCCIGGYHSAMGNVSSLQTYAHFTYIDHAGVFAQDVSALSHEVGEWADDPFVGVDGYNYTECGLLEVGDPLEGEPNYGGYPYTLNGFTYNLQDLVWLPYFGAKPSTSANSWFSFQGESLGICSNGS